MNRSITLIGLGAVALASSACLDPLVSDDVPPEGLVLPAGTAVPDAQDDPLIDGQIAENDGVDGEIPLLAGFADGAPAHYWDFGDTPEFASPLFVLVRRNADDEFEILDHNTIIDVLPGEPGYSPFWAVLFVEVTDAYDGELIPSFAAAQEAQELGLVLPPKAMEVAVNCPAVAKDVTLELGDGNDPMPPPKRFYWKGQEVRYYDFGFIPVDNATIVPDMAMYRLKREGGVALSEPLRNVDMTGDGDTKDTNNIFELAVTDEYVSPLCRTVDVVVHATYRSIDTSADQTIADFRSADDMFDPDPLPESIVAFDETDELRNCPQQTEAGGL